MDGAHRAQVRCFTAEGNPIAVCGHGLLCCAAAWRALGRTVPQLYTAREPIAVRADDDALWLGFSPLPTCSIPMPSWVTTLRTVSQAQALPIAAAEVGGETDYLVLRWPDGADLNAVCAPGSSLGRHTRRGLIVSCRPRQAHAGNAAQVQLRYFAPQYSRSEDAATGSALRALAGCWQLWQGYEALRARQCSREGGLLFSRIAEERTWVGGRVSLRIVRRQRGGSALGRAQRPALQSPSLTSTQGDRV
jgi:predicted PhzF superfamily epimerase YddE/YHI9